MTCSDATSGLPVSGSHLLLAGFLFFPTLALLSIKTSRKLSPTTRKSRVCLVMTRLASSLLPLLFVSSLSADSITPLRYPPGLERGDQYRLFFTTSEFRDATSSDIEVYNYFVQSVADDAPVVGQWDIEWKAVASAGGFSARDNTGTNPEVDGIGVPIYLLDGRLMAENSVNLWGTAGAFGVDLLLTELGTEHDIVVQPEGELTRLVWTGTLQSGIADDNGGLGNAVTVPGNAASTAIFWFSRSVANSTFEYPVYAMSEVLTVPEPDCNVALFLVVVLLLFRTRDLDVRTAFDQFPRVGDHYVTFGSFFL